MKIPTDTIFQLIHSMTASEKRYFKRHYASEKSLNTELFDFINNMREYDEEAVKKHFANTKLSKNLKVYKVQLTELLLKSLTSYYNKKTIRSKIRIGLEEVEILMDKQLYRLAHGRVKKIKALSLKHEEFDYIFAIISFEIMLNEFFNVNLKKPGTYPVLEELEKYTNTITKIHNLKKVNFSLHDNSNNEFTQKLTDKQASFYKEFLNAQKGNIKDLTLSEQYYMNSSLSIINKLIHDAPEEEFKYKAQNVELFEKNPHFVENHARFYYAALFNYLICCRRLGKFKELEKGITSIKELSEKHPFLERNLNFVYYLEAKHNYYQGNFDYLTDLLENQISKHIKKYNQKEEHLTALTFIYFVLAYIRIENYARVHFYLRRLHSISKNMDSSYAQFFHILELISHYETNDSVSFQNYMSALKRKMKKNSDMTPFFKNFILFLPILFRTAPEQKDEVVQNFINEFATFENDAVMNLSREFILNDWLKATSANLSFSKYMAQTSKTSLT